MIADSDQRSVLLRLHDQLDETCVELSASEVWKGFKPPIDALIVEASLAALVQSGLAVSVGSMPTKYRISRVGIAEVERAFDITTTINPSTGIVHRSYSEKLPVPSPSKSFDWGKWGAIAAWIIIPVTIIGIVVAIWLDFN